MPPTPQQQKQGGQLAKATPTQKGKEVLVILESRKDEISKLISTTLSADVLFRIAINCITRTPALQDCTTLSLVQSIITFAEWGLHPNPALGLCYMVPYKQTATPILGYRGMLELARRSGTVAKLEADVVREDDHFVDIRGFNPQFEHRPTWDAKLNKQGFPDFSDVVGVYAIATFKDGLQQVARLSRAEIESIRSRSRAGNDGPWVTDWAEMAKKTALRRLSKFLSFSPEDSEALEKDGDTIEGEVTNRPPALASVQAPPATKALAAKNNAAIEMLMRGSVTPETQPDEAKGETLEHDPQTGEVLEDAGAAAAEQMKREQADLEARMRRADEEAKAAEAAKQAAPPATAPKMPMIDMSAPDAREQLKAAMHLVAADATATPKQLEKLAALGSELPTEQQAEIGTLYIQLRKSMLARKA